jgi:hypothetical protein
MPAAFDSAGIHTLSPYRKSKVNRGIRFNVSGNIKIFSGVLSLFLYFFKMHGSVHHFRNARFPFGQFHRAACTDLKNQPDFFSPVLALEKHNRSNSVRRQGSRNPCAALFL